jgi:hypothetical protein
MNVIISDNGAGGVGVTIVSPKATMSIEDHKAELEAKGVVCHAIVDDSTLPDNAGTALKWELDEDTETVSQVPHTDQRRCYRNTWEWDGSAVVENAVAIGLEKRAEARIIRNKLLAKSDATYLSETERAGPNVNALKAYRQALRDLGAAIDTDPDTLVWPVKP